MSTVDLSVIICTLNRSSLLGKCLGSLLDQASGAYTFETIVVDNGSTDDTKGAVESYRDRLSDLAYVHEPRKGLARARQTGLEVSVGRYVAYLDDDAMAAPHWCSAIVETFEQLKQSPTDNIAALGGPIEPMFETAKPSWLAGELTALYAIVDLGNLQHTFGGPDSPVGANMAFLRAALIDNPWNETLQMCEEIDLFTRLRSRGLRFLYVPGMKVRHLIPAERLAKGWLLRRYFAEGMAHEQLRLGRLHSVRVTVAAFVKLPALLLFSAFGSEGRRLKYGCKIRFYRGYLAALLGARGVSSSEYISARRKAAF